MVRTMTKSNTSKNHNRTCSAKCYCGDQPKEFIAINGTCVVCGKKDKPMRPYMEQVGYESAIRALLRGTYISPKQLFYDGGFDKEMWADFDLFKKGVLEAIEIHRGANDKKKLQLKIEAKLKKYERPS